MFAAATSDVIDFLRLHGPLPERKFSEANEDSSPAAVEGLGGGGGTGGLFPNADGFGIASLFLCLRLRGECFTLHIAFQNERGALHLRAAVNSVNLV